MMSEHVLNSRKSWSVFMIQIGSFNLNLVRRKESQLKLIPNISNPLYTVFTLAKFAQDPSANIRMYYLFQKVATPISVNMTFMLCFKSTIYKKEIWGLLQTVNFKAVESTKIIEQTASRTRPWAFSPCY